MSELSFVTTLVRAAVDRRLHELTDRWRSRLPGEAGADLLGPAQQALSGGKRMRPVLAAVGMTLVGLLFIAFAVKLWTASL